MQKPKSVILNYLRETLINPELNRLLLFSVLFLFGLATSSFSEGKKPSATTGAQEDTATADESSEISPAQSVDDENKSPCDEMTETPRKKEEEKVPKEASTIPEEKKPVQTEPAEAAPSEPETADIQPDETQTPSSPEKITEEPPLIIPQGSRIHTVWVWQESKECLWRLAKKYYGDPWQWKKIFMANRNSILDPNIIFPKQQIVIPAKEETE